MPSKKSLVNVLLLATKVYINFILLFHLGVAESHNLPNNNQNPNSCPKGKVPSFEDGNICVVPLNGTCEDYQDTKHGNLRCGPGSECFKATCRCIEGHTAYADKSGCKMSGTTSFTATTISLTLKNIISPTEALKDSRTSQSTKNEDEHQTKTTTKENVVTEPSNTLDSSVRLKSTVPTTVFNTDSGRVVVAHLISRPGGYGSQGGYHKGSYFGNSTRNNTAISIQRADIKNAVVCSFISSVLFHQLNFP